MTLTLVYRLPKGAKYHWPAPWTSLPALLSACSIRAVDMSTARDAWAVPADQQCRRDGCAGKWEWSSD